MNGPEDSRRLFMRRAGKIVIATPPALAVLLIADGRNYAMAASGAAQLSPGAVLDEQLFDLSYAEAGTQPGFSEQTYTGAVTLDNQLGDPVLKPNDPTKIPGTEPFPNVPPL